MFKRIEVWLLIVGVGAGSIWFAFFQKPAEEIPSTPEMDSSADEARGISLLYGKAEESGDHYLVELRVTAANLTSAPQELIPPFARLTTPEGVAIDPFFLPFAPSPTLEPGPESVAELRYWLPRTAGENIILAIGEQTLQLTLDSLLEELENTAPK